MDLTGYRHISATRPTMLIATASLRTYQAIGTREIGVRRLERARDRERSYRAPTEPSSTLPDEYRAVVRQSLYHARDRRVHEVLNLRYDDLILDGQPPHFRVFAAKSARTQH